jgi:hypothetical protein
LGDAVGSGRVGLVEFGEGFAKVVRILLGDGEDAYAALGAAGTADKVRAAALGGGGESGVYDLDESRQRRSSYFCLKLWRSVLLYLRRRPFCLFRALCF